MYCIDGGTWRSNREIKKLTMEPFGPSMTIESWRLWREWRDQVEWNSLKCESDYPKRVTFVDPHQGVCFNCRVYNQHTSFNEEGNRKGTFFPTDWNQTKKQQQNPWNSWKQAQTWSTKIELLLPPLGLFQSDMVVKARAMFHAQFLSIAITWNLAWRVIPWSSYMENSPIFFIILKSPFFHLNFSPSSRFSSFQTINRHGSFTPR